MSVEDPEIAVDITEIPLDEDPPPDGDDADNEDAGRSDEIASGS